MKIGAYERRAPDLPAFETAQRDLLDLALPFAAQLIYRRYPPSRTVTPEVREAAGKFYQQVNERRDSVLHRAGALAWHVSWSFHIYDWGAGRANEPRVMVNRDRSIENLLATTRDLLYVFDDMVLNAVSLLDYVAQFLAQAITGKGVARWDKLVGCVQRRNGEATYGKALVEMVLELDRVWVGRLVDRRNYIAHQEASRTGGTNSFDPNTFSATFAVDLPVKARTLLDAMGHQPSDGDLLSGAQHLALTCLRGTNQLLTTASLAQRIQPRYIPINFG